MFQQYKTLINKALNDEEIINKEYEDKRNELALEIKKTLQTELQNLNNNQLLKNYSPIRHTNNMTELNSKSIKLFDEEHKKFNNIKKKLDNKLLTIMEIERKPDNFPTELYKIIGFGGSNNNYICRVVFTLVSFQQDDWTCQPGEPIRTEWVNHHGITNVSKRTANGLLGLKIPNIQNIQDNILDNQNELFNSNHWGDTSSQLTAWKEWIKINKPL